MIRAFLIAAYHMPLGSFEALALTVAAIANVPIFLLAVFLLQTKFRPEMQEDAYYSSYLDKKTNTPIVMSRESVLLAQMTQKLSEIEERIPTPAPQEAAQRQPLDNLLIGINRRLNDFTEVAQSLSKHGMARFRGFGTNKTPDKRVVAISEYLSSGTLKDILAVAKTLGFTHYTLFDNRMEGTEEDVLFGSYGEAGIEIE